MTHNEILSIIRKEKIIAILRDIPGDKAKRVLDALYAGGVRALEFTFDHDHADCIERTTANVRLAKELYGDQLLLGCGTVLSIDEADAAVESGAQIIISPNTDLSIIKRAQEKGAASIPGALTPTEIMQAWQAGADFVKLFPAGELGLNYIKAVRAPLRHIPMVAVGGITPENVSAFLKAGILGFGVGGNLVETAALNEGNYARIQQRAQAFTDAIRLA